MSLEKQKSVDGDNGLNEEIAGLWGLYFDYLEKNGSKLVKFQEMVASFCLEHQIDEDVVFVAVERLMIFDFGISLAELCSSALAKKVWPCEFVLVGGDNEFEFQLMELDGNRLELAVDAETLFQERLLPRKAPLSDLESGSQLVDSREFVSLLMDAFEEYAHIVWNSVKAIERKELDENIRLQILSVINDLEDQSKSSMIYHTIPSEYRGLVWKKSLLYRYLPSLFAPYKHFQSQVNEAKRLLLALS